MKICALVLLGGFLHWGMTQYGPSVCDMVLSEFGYVKNAGITIKASPEATTTIYEAIQ